MKEAFMAIPSLWDSRSVECFCTVYRSAACRRESRSLYSFVFLSSDVSQQTTSWALLVNRPCLFRHEENLCLFVICFCHVSTQCTYACWHVSHDHIIHLYHAHSAWLKTSSNSACTKRCCRSLLATGVRLGFPGLPQRGKLPHPPCSQVPPMSPKMVNPKWLFMTSLLWSL